METFLPSKELLSLVDDFSKKWKDLEFGVYASTDSEYIIKYLEEITDSNRNSIRIHLKSKIIEISKSKMVEYEMTSNSIFFLILWQVVYFEITKDKIKCDIITSEYYLSTHRPSKDILNSIKIMGIEEERIAKITDYIKMNAKF